MKNWKQMTNDEKIARIMGMAIQDENTLSDWSEKDVSFYQNKMNLKVYAFYQNLRIIGLCIISICVFALLGTKTDLMLLLKYIILGIGGGTFIGGLLELLLSHSHKAHGAKLVSVGLIFLMSLFIYF